MKQPRIRRALALLPMALLWAACSDDTSPCTTPDCDYIQPVDGTLNVKVTINEQNPQVPVWIYWGDIEDSILVFADTLTDTRREYTADFGTYSGAAMYQDGTRRILAIDGDEVSYNGTDSCDVTCYTQVPGTLSLNLR